MTTDIRRLVVTLTLAGGLVLAGCGGGAPAAPSSSATLSPSKIALCQGFHDEAMTNGAGQAVIDRMNDAMEFADCPPTYTVSRTDPP